jgi:hypothetical protein
MYIGDYDDVTNILCTSYIYHNYSKPEMRLVHCQ